MHIQKKIELIIDFDQLNFKINDEVHSMFFGVFLIYGHLIFTEVVFTQLLAMKIFFKDLLTVILLKIVDNLHNITVKIGILQGK